MQSTMMPGDLMVAELFRHGATSYPDSVVVEYEGDGRASTATFAEVAREVFRLANALADLGVRPGERVGTLAWNTRRHLVAYLAIPSMGAVLHPLNLRLSDEQLIWIVQEAQDRVVLVDATLAGQFQRLLPHLPSVQHVVLMDPTDLQVPDGVTVHQYDDLLSAAADTYDWPAVDERSAAALCYTTGTTGNPKGVAYSHRSLWLHQLVTSGPNVFGFSRHDRVLPIVPMFHVNAWGWPFAAWLNGADIIFSGPHLRAPDLAEVFRTHRPTMAAAVPTIWNDLLRHGRQAALDLASLRLAVSGGSALTRSLVQGMRDEHDVLLIQGWGMTETSPVIACSSPPRGSAGDDRLDWQIHSGQVLPLMQVRIVDEDGRPLPHDGTTVGEIEVRGQWATGEYVGGANPDSFHDGWLRTGDLGNVRPDHWVRVSDRLKDGIKSGGEWISTVELENLLSEHPGVTGVAVVGIPDERWDERPLVCVTLEAGSATTAEDLRSGLEGRVPRFAVPDAWAIVDELPMTSVGKLDKKVLRAQHADGTLPVVVVGRAATTN